MSRTAARHQGLWQYGYKTRTDVAGSMHYL